MDIRIGKLVITQKIAIIAGAALVVLAAGGIFGYKVISGSIGSKWVAKINGEKITLKEFNDLFYAQNRAKYNVSNEEIDKLAADPEKSSQDPSLNKGEFLNQILDNALVYQEAVKAGYDKNPEVKILAEYQSYTIAASLFSQSLYNSTVKPTDEEIAQVYQSYKSRLNNAKLEEVKDMIASDLIRQKAMAEQSKRFKELRDAVTIDRGEVINKLSDPDVSKRPKKGDVLTIKGKNVSTKTISVEEFENGYYAQMKAFYKVDNASVDKLAADPNQLKQNPALEKKKFLDKIIEMYLLYEEAKSKGILKKDDYIALTNFYDKSIAVQYFLHDKFMKDITITPAEIADEYNKVRSKFPPNVTPDQAEMYIKQGLEARKLQEKLEEYIPNLRDKAEKEKNLKLLENPVKK
jgi:hypothetical protein